jgi:putative GTP pyrophosphokinase
MPDEMDKLSGKPFPYTISQVNKAGERIRKATVRRDRPTAADLQLLDDYRAWHQPTLEECQRQLVALLHKRLELDPDMAFITGRPLKTVEAITAKLVRSKPRLATMQDIAGTRVVVPTLDFQNAVTALVAGWFFDDGLREPKDTREDGDDYGYRAVHLVATLDGRFAEIQIRTRAQDAWAQIVERTDKMIGADLKHGSGPAEWLDWLLELSHALRQIDLGRPVNLPPTPFDRLIKSEEENAE